MVARVGYLVELVPHKEEGGPLHVCAREGSQEGTAGEKLLQAKRRPHQAPY